MDAISSLLLTFIFLRLYGRVRRAFEVLSITSANKACVNVYVNDEQNDFGKQLDLKESVNDLLKYSKELMQLNTW